MTHLIACLIACLTGSAGYQVLVSSTSAPAGSTAQIRISLANPQRLAAGEVSFDLDPAIFATVTAVTAFSAAGDAFGYAILDGRHASIKFSSPSGTLGGIVGNPFVVLTVAIRPDAVPGSRATVAADPGSSPWLDPIRTQQPVSVAAGTITVGGTLSIGSVQPGSGMLPAGSVIRIDGTGFTAASTVEIQAAVVSASSCVSPTQINVTLGGPTEIAGKRVRVRNPDGEQVEFFPSWTGGVLSTSPADPYFNAFPILSSQAYRQSATASFRVDSGWLVVQNPNPDPVDVVLQLLQNNYSPSAQTTLRIPAGGSSYQNLATLGVPLENSLRVLASAPVRTLELSAYTNYFGGQPFVPLRGASPLSPIDLGPLRVEADRNEDSLSWVWQTGAARPAARTFHVRSVDRDQSAAFTVAVATASGGPWLAATPSAGVTCPILFSSCTDPSIVASVDPTGLAPGIYRGTITLTPAPTAVRPDVLPTIVAVSLTISAAPFVNNVVNFSATFVKPGPPNGPGSIPYNISSDIFPCGFSIAVRTASGGNWLTATATSTTAPAVVTLSGDLSNLAPGRYAGEVVLTGGGNTMVIPAMAFVYGGLQLSTDYPLRFAARAGDPAPAAQIAAVTPQCAYCADAPLPDNIPFSAFVKTNSGGNWLAALPSANLLSVSVNPAGLAPGVYSGVITLTSNTTPATQIPVALTVWSGTPPGLSSSPSSLFSTWPGAIGGYLCVSAGSGQVTLAARASTSDGGNWLTVRLTAPVTPTCGIGVYLDGSSLAPGTYHGSVIVTASGQSLSIPVTLFVPPAPRPSIGSIVNAASAIEGAIAQGEIVTIHGIGLGREVLFDTTPAQLIYASDAQINAIVPNDVAGKTSAGIQVRFNGQSSGWTVPVASAAPGIFTLDSSGVGAAAVLNQDNTVNTPANPAARGSVIQIFATGVNVPNPGATVSVTVGGVDAFIQYAGPAPRAVAGLYQVNVVVPSGVAPGPAVPVVLSVGSTPSQTGATIGVN